MQLWGNRNNQGEAVSLNVWKRPSWRKHTSSADHGQP